MNVIRLFLIIMIIVAGFQQSTGQTLHFGGMVNVGVSSQTDYGSGVQDRFRFINSDIGEFKAVDNKSPESALYSSVFQLGPYVQYDFKNFFYVRAYFINKYDVVGSFEYAVNEEVIEEYEYGLNYLNPNLVVGFNITPNKVLEVSINAGYSPFFVVNYWNDFYDPLDDFVLSDFDTWLYNEYARGFKSFTSNLRLGVEFKYYNYILAISGTQSLGSIDEYGGDRYQRYRSISVSFFMHIISFDL